MIEAKYGVSVCVYEDARVRERAAHVMSACAAASMPDEDTREDAMRGSARASRALFHHDARARGMTISPRYARAPDARVAQVIRRCTGARRVRCARVRVARCAQCVPVLPRTPMKVRDF